MFSKYFAEYDIGEVRTSCFNRWRLCGLVLMCWELTERCCANELSALCESHCIHSAWSHHKQTPVPRLWYDDKPIWEKWINTHNSYANWLCVLNCCSKMLFNFTITTEKCGIIARDWVKRSWPWKCLCLLM